MNALPALNRILAACAFKGMSPGLKRLLEKALATELATAERAGRDRERSRCAGLAGCKALLFATDADPTTYRALRSLEGAICEGADRPFGISPVAVIAQTVDHDWPDDDDVDDGTGD